MKAKVFIMSALVFGALSLASCEQIDNYKYTPGSAVTKAFEDKYPGAEPTSWENKAGLDKVEFMNGPYEADAWFDKDGNWVMTETDIPYNALPQAVKDSFEASQYADWKVDDVDMIERPDAETMYILEVEKGEMEVDLHYMADGILIKEVIDNDHNNNDDEHIPSVTPDSIIDMIMEMYPGAKILEVETEKNRTEVEILHENIVKEVLFDLNNNWLHSEWEITLDQVPEAVINALKASEYAAYEIDEITVLHKAEGLFYEVELEQGRNEVKIVFNEAGEIVTLN